jgi:hypothetical protein
MEYNTSYLLISCKLICADCGDLTDKPTYDNLIVFSPQDITIKEKGREDVQVGFLNDHPTAKYWLMEVIDPNGIKCGPSPAPNTICAQVPVTYNMKAFSLERDEVTGWYLVFQPKSGTVKSLAPDETNVYIFFTVKFCGVASASATECPVYGNSDFIAEYTKQIALDIKR